MQKSKFFDFFVSGIMEKINDLNEMGGPDTTEEFVAVLEEVKKQIDVQIEAAKTPLKKACPKCSAKTYSEAADDGVDFYFCENEKCDWTEYDSP